MIGSYSGLEAREQPLPLGWLFVVAHSNLSYWSSGRIDGV